MEGSIVGILIARAFQFAFAAVVLGLAISLVHDIDNVQDRCDVLDGPSWDLYHCHLGRLPSSTIFAGFVGGWGILAAFVGFVGAVASARPWVGNLLLDGLAAAFFLASGINLAVLRAEGCYSTFCNTWTTCTVFMFLSLVITLVAMGTVVAARNRRGSSRPITTAV